MKRILIISLFLAVSAQAQIPKMASIDSLSALPGTVNFRRIVQVGDSLYWGGKSQWYYYGLASEMSVVRPNVTTMAFDTTSISNRINAKLNASSANSMVYADSTYWKNLVNSKLSPSDTLSLSNRINAKLAASAVGSGAYTDSAYKNNQLALKLAISSVGSNAYTDSSYENAQRALKLNSTDTLSLSNRINTKLAISSVGSEAYTDSTYKNNQLATKLAAASNLSDVGNAATARTNLGLKQGALLSDTTKYPLTSRAVNSGGYMTGGGDLSADRTLVPDTSANKLATKTDVAAKLNISAVKQGAYWSDTTKATQWDGGTTNLVAATGRSSLGLSSMWNVDSVSYSGALYADSVSFTTTALRVAKYISGNTTTGIWVAQARITSDATPNASDIQLTTWSKPDSVIIHRIASGTSGLKVNLLGRKK